MTTTLLLPWSKPPLTSNDASRSTGRAHARTRRDIRTVAAFTAKQQHLEPHPQCDVLITWYAPDAKRRDAGSLTVLLKHWIDGLVDAGVWPDDDYRYVRTESCRVVVDRDNPRMEVKLTEVERLAWMADEREKSGEPAERIEGPIVDVHIWHETPEFGSEFLETCIECGQQRVNEERRAERIAHQNHARLGEFLG